MNNLQESRVDLALRLMKLAQRARRMPQRDIDELHAHLDAFRDEWRRRKSGGPR